jgi:hypothetical protein
MWSVPSSGTQLSPLLAEAQLRLRCGRGVRSEAFGREGLEEAMGEEDGALDFFGGWADG